MKSLERLEDQVSVERIRVPFLGNAIEWGIVDIVTNGDGSDDRVQVRADSSLGTGVVIAGLIRGTAVVDSILTGGTVVDEIDLPGFETEFSRSCLQSLKRISAN